MAGEVGRCCGRVKRKSAGAAVWRTGGPREAEWRAGEADWRDGPVLPAQSTPYRVVH